MGAQDNVQKILDKAVNEKEGPAGLVFASIDKTGKMLACASAGVQSLDKPNEPMTIDSVFPIWSCTKMIASMACMQLVEQGKIHLDEPAEKHLPELGTVKMINGDAPKSKITMRQLLTHTAGFSYTFFDEELNERYKKTGIDEFSGSREGTFGMPLVREPGQEWHYSTGIDWAGQVLEAVTKQTLGEYCKENIFDPLGCKDIQFGVNPKHRSRLVGMHTRSPDGKLTSKAPLPFHTSKPAFDSGGAGCTSTVTDYLKVVNVLINDGVGANGKRIITSETLKEMLKDQITDLPQKDPLDQDVPAVRPEYTLPAPMMPGLKKGWGLSFLIVQDPLPTGRAGGAVWWAGLANLYWMADHSKGTANMILSQSLPFNDPKVLGPWLACEGACYASMAQEASLEGGIENLKL